MKWLWQKLRDYLYLNEWSWREEMLGIFACVVVPFLMFVFSFEFHRWLSPIVKGLIK